MGYRECSAKDIQDKESASEAAMQGIKLKQLDLIYINERNELGVLSRIDIYHKLSGS